MNKTVIEMLDITQLRTQLVALTRRLRQSARADNETWTGLMVLGVIERSEGEATPSLIATELELRSSNVAATLADLQQRGLVQRTSDPHDKRKVRLALTPDGSALLRETRAQRDRWLRSAINACLTADEKATLQAAGDLMERLANWQRATP